jgi:AraC family transcriptional regulator
MNSPVEHAISYIWEQYSEPISLSDIAASAILSRFHFSRVFKDATGVSPGRFLSAVRIYHAKRMLVATSLNVTDISFAVGFNSLGSFTNHFTDSVGISPARFRRASKNGGFKPPEMPDQARGPGATVEGTVRLPDGYAAARAYVGAFSTPIVQRRPVSAAIVNLAPPAPTQPYQLANVPDGNWFIHVVAVADTADPEPWSRRVLLIGSHGAVRVAAGGSPHAEIRLRPRCPTDLPILLALPDLETELDSLALAGAEPAADERISPTAASS